MALKSKTKDVNKLVQAMVSLTYIKLYVENIFH